MQPPTPQPASFLPRPCLSLPLSLSPRSPSAPRPLSTPLTGHSSISFSPTFTPITPLTPVLLNSPSLVLSMSPSYLVSSPHILPPPSLSLPDVSLLHRLLKSISSGSLYFLLLTSFLLPQHPSPCHLPPQTCRLQRHDWLLATPFTPLLPVPILPILLPGLPEPSLTPLQSHLQP